MLLITNEELKLYSEVYNQIHPKIWEGDDTKEKFTLDICM